MRAILFLLFLAIFSVSLAAGDWPQDNAVKKLEAVRSSLQKGDFKAFSALVIPSKKQALTPEIFKKAKDMVLQMIPDPAKNKPIRFESNADKAIMVFKVNSPNPKMLMLGTAVFVKSANDWKLDLGQAYSKGILKKGDEKAQITKELAADPKFSLNSSPAAKPAPASAPASPQPVAKKPISPPLPVLPGSKSKRFRAGTILAAEITNRKINFKNRNKYDSPESFKKAEERQDPEGVYAFACLAVKLDPRRSIGKYDYILSDGVNDFKCYALSLNDEDFDFDKWEIKNCNRNDICRLLYEVKLPPVDIKKMKKIQYALQFKILGDSGKEIIIPFQNIGDKDFTACNKIPAMGMLAIDEPTRPGALPPGKKPAATPKPAPKSKATGALPEDIGPSLPAK